MSCSIHHILCSRHLTVPEMLCQFPFPVFVTSSMVAVLQHVPQRAGRAFSVLAQRTPLLHRSRGSGCVPPGHKPCFLGVFPAVLDSSFGCAFRLL